MMVVAADPGSMTERSRSAGCAGFTARRMTGGKVAPCTNCLSGTACAGEKTVSLSHETASDLQTVSITQAASQAPAARAMSSALRPKKSSKVTSAPAARRILQMEALLWAADSMRGVCPLSSRALRLSPRSMWILTALSTPATTAILRNRLKDATPWAGTTLTLATLPITRPRRSLYTAERLANVSLRGVGVACVEPSFLWPFEPDVA